MLTLRSSFLVRLALVCASLLCVAACDDPPSAGESYVQIVGATCDKVHDCRRQYRGVEGRFEVEWGATVEDCRMRYGFAGVVGGQIQEQVDRGRIDYDADAAETCLDGLADTTCAQLWLPLGSIRQPSACSQVFTSAGD